MQLLRLMKIQWTLMRYVINREVIRDRAPLLRRLSYCNPLSWKKPLPRGEALRLALEELGPIFVKFGQILSTRRDLLPDDVAKELAKLQDQVPPFSNRLAKHIIEHELDAPVSTLFAQFDETPLASASIAQVHAATLHSGEDVVIKVLRPNIQKTIKKDISLMHSLAKLAVKVWAKGRRLRPVEIVGEFEHTLYDELDLVREAANAAQLRRNFDSSHMLYIPKIYWDYTRTNVMVMERIYGVPVNDINTLNSLGVNLKTLAEYGVEIFFTQVFRDSFFHADMHPGNIFINVDDPGKPYYNGVDFGIMGTLTPEDQQYLAENFLAFFNRDYRQVALLHIESGWVPADTRVDQFESAMRTVCEPIFERPINEISFGKFLLRLFQTAERFDMKVQPQLFLLQKTLLNIEGLGRQLYPELDLWATAKPFLENWMKERMGVKALLRKMLRDFPVASEKIRKLPELLYDVLKLIQTDSVKKRSDEHFTD